MPCRERAQATNLIFFFLTLGVAVMMFWFADPLNQEVIGEARNTTSNTTALEGVRYMELMANNVLFIVVLIALLGLLTFAIFEQELL